MEKTLGFAKALRPDTAQFFPIMVYPGTTAYQEAEDRNYIQIEDWSAWLTKDGLHNSVVTLPNITHEQLVSFCDRARRSFYLDPAYLVYKLKQSLKDGRELQRNLRVSLRFRSICCAAASTKKQSQPLRERHRARRRSLGMDSF